MNRIIIVPIVIVVMLTVLAACAVRKNEVKPEPARPQKEAVSAEDQALLDRYYAEMKQKYPEFGAIPREMLVEQVRYNEGIFQGVTFAFYFGGFRTGCQCIYSVSDSLVNDGWRLHENSFKKYYNTVFPETTAAEIRNTLTAQIREYIDANKLDGSGLTEDSLYLYWQDNDGKLCVETEYIASVTPETTTNYGCWDHAHIFGRVYVEFGNEIKLTFDGVGGS